MTCVAAIPSTIALPEPRLADLSKLVQDSVPYPDTGRRRVLLACPTLRRRAQAVENLRLAMEMSSGRHELVPVLVVNADDEQWPEGADHAGPHPLPPQARVLRIKAGSTKVEAHNAAPADFEARGEAWDLLVLLADDQKCEVRGWDEFICRELYRQWDDGDGVVHASDGVTHKALCTQCIMGRRYYLRDDYVYNPQYRSFFCDDEFTHWARARGRLLYRHRVLFRHLHPAHISGRVYDSTYTACTPDFEPDFQKWQYRQCLAPLPPLLSVVIITTPHRDERRARLVAQWQAQRDEWLIPGVHVVELVFVKDCRELSRGVKRQMGLEAAKGVYVMHADDDDPLADGFLDNFLRACDACERPPYPDCFELHGVLHSDSGTTQCFHHSIAYDGWSNDRPVLTRTPNHCNIIRREIALRVPFFDKHYGEDSCWSRRIRPHLHTEGTFLEVSLEYHPRETRAAEYL
jgi:hypothetical protein